MPTSAKGWYDQVREIMGCTTRDDSVQLTQEQLNAVNELYYTTPTYEWNTCAQSVDVDAGTIEATPYQVRYVTDHGSLGTLVYGNSIEEEKTDPLEMTFAEFLSEKYDEEYI